MYYYWIDMTTLYTNIGYIKYFKMQEYNGEYDYKKTGFDLCIGRISSYITKIYGYKTILVVSGNIYVTTYLNVQLIAFGPIYCLT